MNHTELPNKAQRVQVLRSQRNEALARAFKAREELDAAREEIKRTDMALAFMKDLVDPVMDVKSNDDGNN